MSDKPAKELKAEVLKTLDLSVADDSEASLKACTKSRTLPKLLQQLPKLYETTEGQIYEQMIKSYRKNLKPEAVVEAFKPSEIKEAVVGIFKPEDILSTAVKAFKKREDEAAAASGSDETIAETADIRYLLARLPPDALLEEVRRRMDRSSSSS